MTRELIRKLERESIEKFVSDNQNLLTGKVLDWGCGTMPYQKYVLGKYVPFDLDMKVVTDTDYDTILFTQVVQELEFPEEVIESFKTYLKPGGHILMTFPTAWEEYDADLWRFTAKGMSTILNDAGFKIKTMTPRFSIPFEDFNLVIGYGCIAQS